MIRSGARRVAIAAVATAIVVGAWPGSHASALAPEAVGYWVVAQTRPPDPLPLSQVLPPADPVVPKGGLYVANSADGPTGVSALKYEVDGAMSAELLLQVHSYTPPPPSEVPVHEAPSEAPSPNPSLITVAACMTDPWLPTPDGSAGAWEDRPRYSDNCTLGQFSLDGSTVTFHLRPDMQASEAVFDIAIIPMPTFDENTEQHVNRPFSVVFSPPREESLSPGETDDSFEEDEDFDFDPFAGMDTGDFSGGDAFPVFDGGPATVIAPPAPSPTPPVTTARTMVRRVANPVAVFTDDSRGERIMAVTLLMALALGLWWIGGQETRGPQLLGSLGAAGASRTGRTGEPLGGIGRFARPRTTRPRRLL